MTLQVEKVTNFWASGEVISRITGLGKVPLERSLKALSNGTYPSPVNLLITSPEAQKCFQPKLSTPMLICVNACSIELDTFGGFWYLIRTALLYWDSFSN